MARLAGIALAVLLASQLVAAAARGWSPVPLAKWSEARTLDSCWEALHEEERRRDTADAAVRDVERT